MKFIPGWIVVAALVGVARADSIWISTNGGSGATNAIETSDATITRVAGDRLYFMAGSAETSREVSQIARIAVTDDPALTAAETDYSKGDWDAASDDYERALRSPTRPWMRDWAAVRLLDTASKAGRFDAAVSAYVSLVQTRPDVAEKNRPAAAAAKPSQLESAATELTSAAGHTNLTVQQQRSILTLLFDVQHTRGDAVAAGSAAEQLLKLATPGDELQSQYWRLAVTAALIERRDYGGALAAIEKDRATFTDSPAQAEALYLTARAKEASATGADSLKDAALAYMRVVAFFKDSPGASHVDDSLNRAAAILERLNDKPAADRLRAKNG